MLPAFSSIRQAILFIVLLFFVLLLPVMIRKPWLPARESVYSSLPWGVGAYPYLDQQIFQEQGPIDIAIMGSSKTWWAIDAREIQNQLSEKLGRKAAVRSLCWNSPGCDALYYTLQDLLQHRKLHTLVFCDCSIGSNHAPHPRAPYFFRFSENFDGLAGLGSRAKMGFYASAIMGAPRLILNLVRPNQSAIASETIAWPPWNPQFTNVASPMNRLGTLTVEKFKFGPFEKFVPQTGANPESFCVYSDQTKDQFQFSGDMPSTQAAFMAKVGVLAKKYDVQLIYVHLPSTDEKGKTVMKEPAFLPATMNSHLDITGIPPQLFFGGMTDGQVDKLFFNYEHLNENGQRYFTSLIAPGLISLYEKKARP